MDGRQMLYRLFVSACPVVLGGCAAAAVAPLVIHGASIVGGNLESAVTVTIDEKTITPEIRDAFATAKSLAFVAGDRGSVKAADVFETEGGYLVSIDRSTAKNGELTTSERRDALRKLCSTSRPDIALLGRVTKSENTGVAYVMLTGRAKSNQNWVLDLLVCRSNTPLSFSGALEFDEGSWNATSPAQIEEMVGAALGKKLLETVGKAKPDAGQTTAGASDATSTKTAAAANPISMTPTEIQQKLIDLGYLKGKADGIFGKMSVAALKKFQRDSNLPETGKADDETVARLAAARKT